MKALSLVLSLVMAGAVVWFGCRYATGNPDWDHGLLTFAETPLPTHDSEGRPLIPCPDCQATGNVPCPETTCNKGMVPCPSPCLKLSVGEWEKLKVEGHDPELLWQVVRRGKHWRAWNQNNVGEIIDEVNGEQINKGKCPACGGQTVVVCSRCKGSTRDICGTCLGARVLIARPPKKEEPAPAIPSNEPAPAPAIPDPS